MLDDIFKDIFPITKNNEVKDKNKTIVYNFGGKTIVTKSVEERLELGLRLAHAALNKRKMAMDIMERRLQADKQSMMVMENRLQENQKLIQRMDAALQGQSEMLDRQQQIIESQQDKLNHIEIINSRMDNLHHEQAQIIQFAQEYRQSNV